MKNSTNKFRMSFILICTSILISSIAQAQSGIYFAGSSCGLGNTGSGCTGVGTYCLGISNSGYNNSAFGSYALMYNSTGYSNTAIGSLSMGINLSGYSNTAIGFYSLRNNTTGNQNCAFGDSALYSNNRSGNSAFGSSALKRNTIGDDNNAFGYRSLYSNDSGSANSAFGSYALFANTKGYQNCAFGTYVLDNNTSGYNNSAFGFNTLTSNTNGYSNAAMGDYAMDHNTTGYFNTGIGSNALHLSTNANNSVGIGYLAGGTQAKYIKCTFIGATADATLTNLNNATAIGYGAKVNGSNKVRVGNTAVTSIGGQVGWTTLSDLRLKENIQDSKLGLNFILNLNPVTYNYKDEEQKGILYTGLIAQEVDAAAKKEGVEFSGVDKNGEYWGIRYGDLTVPLIKGMQEMNESSKVQVSKVQELEKNNAEQQSEINELRNTITQLQQCIESLCTNQQKINLNDDANNSTQLSLSPNPTSDVVKIKVTSTDKKSLVVKIMDASGKLIISYIADGNSVFEFNTTTLSKGTYLVQMFNQNELIQTEKLIVQ